ncbi:MAG: TolC family protein [Rectinemataceae bacterium]|jgi:outer membrane protein TolC
MELSVGGSDLLFRTIFLLSAFLPLASLASQEAPPTLTLARCVDQALAEGSDNRILQRNLDMAREQYGLSLSQASFTLSGSLGENATDGFGNTALLSENSLAVGFAQSPQAGLSLASPMTSVSLNSTPYIAASPLAAALPEFAYLFPPGPTGMAGVSFNQVLWNGYPGGIARAATQKSLLALQGQELSAVVGRSNIVSAVSQAYFVMLGYQLDLAAKREIRDQQDSLLVQIRSTFDMGLADEVDRRSAEINARNAEIEEQNAENALRTARSRLAQLLGKARDYSFAVSEEEDPKVPVASVDEAVAEALRRRIEIRQIEIDRQAATIDRDLIKGQRTPAISVSGGVNLIYQWQGSALAGQGSLGAKLSLPVLDSGAVAHQLEANALQNEDYGIQEGQLRAKIATDVEEAFDLVQIQLKRLETAKLAVERSALRFKLRKTEVAFGTVKNQDLLDASVEFANARSAVTDAQRNAQLAVLQLRNLMGY